MENFTSPEEKNKSCNLKGHSAVLIILSKMFFGCHLLEEKTLHSSDALLLLVSAARFYVFGNLFF